MTPRPVTRDPGALSRIVSDSGGGFASTRIAAFFDLDGTLLPLPSLERRLFRALRARHAIPASNYLRWLTQSIASGPRGARMVHANKTYLRNVSLEECSDAANSMGTLACADFKVAAGQPAIAKPHPLPAFFPVAIKRAAWHARQGHAIVFVSGTLEFLAKQAALALLLRLLVRGITTPIAVCATHLEQDGQRYSGQIRGEAIFGEAKVRAMHDMAAKNDFDLSRSYAYADGTQDRWMLGAVGQPFAVNPTHELERIARCAAGRSYAGNKRPTKKPAYSRPL
jgi:phosphoserine phosphatase